MQPHGVIEYPHSDIPLIHFVSPLFDGAAPLSNSSATPILRIPRLGFLEDRPGSKNSTFMMGMRSWGLDALSEVLEAALASGTWRTTAELGIRYEADSALIEQAIIKSQC